MCQALGRCCDADNLRVGLVLINYNGTSDCIKCCKRAIKKVSKVKLILSRGQERAQREADISEDPTPREAFWELEKGQKQRKSESRVWSVKGLSEKGEVAGYRVNEPHNKSV